MKRPHFGILLCIFLCLLTSGARVAQAQDGSEGDGAADGPQRVEVRVIRESMASRHWLVRAVAAMQLEGQTFPEVGTLLAELAEDRDWRVRAFTIRSIGRRQDAASIITEPLDDRDPHVLRIAMMHGLPVDDAMLMRLATSSLRSRSTQERMMGVELAALSDNEDLRRRALDKFADILVRATPAELVYISRRLGPACGLLPNARQGRWEDWLERCIADNALHMRITPTTTPPAWKPQPEDETDDTDADDDDAPPPLPPARIADLTAEQYVRFRDDYLSELKAKPIDLVICIDRSGSMRDVIDGVKAGVDQMIRFLSDVALRLRVGVVTYAGDPSELTGQQLTTRPSTIKDFVWQIELGAGATETVFLALQGAIKENRYSAKAVSSVVLIGDEPFQSRHREELRELVHYAGQEGIVVSTVKAAGPNAATRDGRTFLPQWDEIADWSGGRSVTMEKANDITAMIIGLTIGGSWVDQIDDLVGAYNECIP